MKLTTRKAIIDVRAHLPLQGTHTIIFSVPLHSRTLSRPSYKNYEIFQTAKIVISHHPGTYSL